MRPQDEVDVAVVLAEFAAPIPDEHGVSYTARAVAAAMADGLWEGWIEFIPVADGSPVRTSRETTQPNLRDARYWASGLTAFYLQGALDRALSPLVKHLASKSEPVFDRPAPPLVRKVEVPHSDAILDPFDVYARGELSLRRKLGALAPWHLVRIIVAHDLSQEPKPILEVLSPSSLIELIVGSVRERAGASGRGPGGAQAGARPPV